MAQWHYQRGGEKIGPVSSSELKRLAESGELSSTDMVWRDGNEPGVQASKVKGLFPTGVPSQSPRSPGVKRADSPSTPQEVVSQEIDAPRGVIAHKKWMLAGAGAVAVFCVACVLWYTVIRNNSGADQVSSGVKARVQGGAWLTKQAGNSEPIRGLNIYFIATQATPTQQAEIVLRITAQENVIVRDEIEKQKFALNVATRNLKAYQGQHRTHYENDGHVPSAEEEWILSKISLTKRDVENAEQKIKKLENHKRVEVQASSSGVVDTKELYKLCHRRAIECSSPFPAWQTWEECVLDEAVLKTLTDVDGKYNIEVPRGKYYAYARHESAYSVTEWMVPVDATNSEAITLQFHNETAESIVNKKVE